MYKTYYFFIWTHKKLFKRISGENCHRGAVVGCLLGAANGAAGRDLNSTTWWKDLSLAPRIQSCINKL